MLVTWRSVTATFALRRCICGAPPRAKNNTEDADGNWKHVEGGWQTSAYDKRQMRAMAKELFDKWGENSTAIKKITLINL